MPYTMTAEDAQDAIERAVCEPIEHPSNRFRILDSLMRTLADGASDEDLRAAVVRLDIPATTTRTRSGLLTSIRSFVFQQREEKR